MTQTRQFDARDVIITWGPVELQGANDGTFVNVEFDEDAVKKHTGAQGHVTATVQANDGGKLTWTGSMSSATNDLLSAYAAIQRAGGGLVKMPLLMRHINGTTLAIGPEAWIMKEAGVSFASEHTPREWAFDIAHLTMFVGGSTR